MIGFVSKSAIFAIVLLTATFANAGDLRPAPQGGNTMHPAPQGSKDTAVANANENGLDSVTKEKEAKLKLRELRPAN